MHSRTLLSVVPFLSVIAGCSSSDGSGTQTTPIDKGDQTAELGEPFRIAIDVPDVKPGEEGTKCLKIRLGNDGAAKIGKVHNTLAASSHHLVVSAVEDPAEEEAALVDCAPFRAVLIGAPFTVTQKHDDVITMPDGVGFPVIANQLMHLEMHYINTGTEVADVHAESELFPITHDEDVQEASFLLVGNLDITIPPNMVKENPPAFVAVPDAFAGVTFYAATGHTHRFGTEARLATASDADDEGSVIYDPQPFTWNEAALKYYDPPFQVPSGGGFRFSCKWENPTTETIKFGESALDEMCFFWTYYYPRREGSRTLLTGVGSFTGAGSSM
jgi:hypothetical protein